MPYLKVAGDHVMDEPVAGVLSHAALFYRGQAEYAGQITAFIQAGLARGEPALIALPGGKAQAIGARLDAMPGELVFADMTELGRNPARIIPVVRAFSDKHPGQRVRFVGEPIWPGRSAAEICEATRHEALINLAFAQVEATILCPYDTAGLAGSVLDAALRTHQEPAASGATAQTWRANLPPDCDRPLPPPPADAETLAYDTDLAPVRRLVDRHAQRAGLGEHRAVDLVLAANEIAANTISHTAGSGMIHVWHTGEEILCQVHDQGWITDPMAGRIRHGPDDRGHGLWLVNLLCDLVELRSGQTGTTVRMHMRRGASPGITAVPTQVPDRYPGRS
jgi:anti-sigma regulatory factor (Ser/Thr protein kinase)